MKLRFTPKIRYLLWLICLPLVAWAAGRLPWEEVWTSLSRLGAGQLLALVVINCVIFALFTSRWWLILRSQGFSVSFLALVGYRLAAFGVTYFTPGPQMGGEPLQVYLLRSHHKIPGSTAVASVTLDKLFELQANFVFLIFGAFVVLQSGLLGATNLGGWRDGVLALGIGLLLLPAVYMMALWRKSRPLTWLISRAAFRFVQRDQGSFRTNASQASQQPAHRVSFGENVLLNPLMHLDPAADPHGLGSKPDPKPQGRLEGRLRKVRALILSAEDQAGDFFREKPRIVLAVSALSLLILFTMFAEYWLALHFLGLVFSPLQVVSALTAARIAFLLPVPAGIGMLEGSQALAMQALGAGAALGVSVSLLIRARDVTFAGLGLWLGAALVGHRRAPDWDQRQSRTYTDRTYP